MKPLAACLATVLATALAGCGDDLRFRRDERVRFVSPPARSLVDGPLVLRWQARSPLGRDRVFGVFVDRSPMRPGEGLDALARHDESCIHDPRCPDREWLRRENVHLTRRAELVLPLLPSAGGRDIGDRRRHEVTLVLLDGRGRRLGESAWSLVLFTPSDGSP